jgi:WD40 repeat protein
VSWRNGAGADYSRHVALGLTGFNSAEKGLTSTQSGVGSSNVDREYCCMVWDIEGQSGAKGSKQSPLFRLAHNVGVSSLSWVEGGQLLAVGTQVKNVQLYDLRASGTNAPPISFAAHRDDVSGIEADPSRPSIFATFSKTPGESVKLWDLRKPDTFLSEIKVNVAVPGSSKLSSSTVSAISWNQINSGSLCIAAGDLLRYYDTNVSKPILTKVTHMNEPVQSIAFRSKEISPTVHMPFERMIVVNMTGEVNDIPLEQLSPLAICHRDGRIIHAFGHNMWIYPSVKGKQPFLNIVT